MLNRAYRARAQSAAYRVIYRVTHEHQLLEIVRVWHAARGEPEGVYQGMKSGAAESSSTRPNWLSFERSVSGCPLRAVAVCRASATPA